MVIGCFGHRRWWHASKPDSDAMFCATLNQVNDSYVIQVLSTLRYDQSIDPVWA
jgi:hypothetical protein